MHIYFYDNISDKKYLVINPLINISEAFDYYMSIVPSEVLKASQMPNALAILKIKLVNEKFIKETEDNLNKKEELNESCYTCANMSCKVETQDKIKDPTACAAYIHPTRKLKKIISEINY